MSNNPQSGVKRKAPAKRKRIRRGWPAVEFSRKLFIAAALLHLFMFLPENIVPRSNRMFFFILVLIASCAISGFIIAYKTLDLGDEEWRQSGIASFLGPNLRANLLFMFGLTFLIPFLNLPIIIFGYFKTTAALRELEKYEDEKSEREAKKWLKWKMPGDDKLDYRAIDFPGFSPASPNDAPQAAQPKSVHPERT